MMVRIGLLGLVLTAPIAIADAAPQDRGDQGNATQQQESSDQAALIKPPPDSKLVGSSVLDEIRAFPEMGKGGRPQAAKVVGVQGIDRVFQTKRKFSDTVSYFDRQFKQAGYKILARVETPSAVAWTVQRPDGTVANAVVRDTKPTTFEIAEANVAAATVTPQQ